MAIKSGKKWLVFGLMLWLLGLLLLAAPLLAVAFSILPAHSGLALLCVVWLPAESIIVEGRRNLSKFVHRIPTNVSAIVYLRSFRDDGKSLAPRKEVDDFYQFRLASSIFNRALLAIGVLILDILKIPFGTRRVTFEEELCATLNRIAPVVAIGKPGEKLPSFGAARLYVDDASWKECVADFLSKSVFVVWKAAVTQGTLWELEYILENVPPHKVLVIMPDARNDAIYYAAVREELSKRLPHLVPILLVGDPDRFWRFDRFWKPEFLPLIRYGSWWTRLIVSRSHIDFERTLEPFLAPWAGYVSRGKWLR